MYQAIAYHKNTNTVHIWDDHKGHIKVKYKPYAYRKSSYGKYVALDGTLVDKVFDFDPHDKNLYESWDLEQIENLTFNNWFKTHSHLFESKSYNDMRAPTLYMISPSTKVGFVSIFTITFLF